jgi:hypothetical protein
MHILPGTLIPYTVRFENDEEVALASVQLLTIVDPLPDTLDWTTFEFGNMVFWHHEVEVPPGLQYYHTQVDIRERGQPLIVDIEATFDPDTGIVEWVFTGLDPDTGELTFDVFAGFLPPNNENHDGEGAVSFLCAARADLPDNTVIENAASIIFDWNEPIDTPPVINTIDRTAPTSSVTALPAESPAAIPVTWTGADNQGGSGIAVYDVFVSSDGGATYTPWLKNTEATGGTYAGQVGTTYRFYCVATDWVGLREGKAPTAEATTLAKAVPAVALDEPFGGQAKQVLNPGDWLTIGWSYEDPEDDAVLGLHWDTDLNLLNNTAAGRESGAWGLISQNILDNGPVFSHDWQLPDTLPETWIHVYATIGNNVGSSTDYALTAIGIGDRDGDGMLDSWEEEAVAVLPGVDTIEQFLPGIDSDGDGWTNYDEFAGGSDPADPNSGLDWRFRLFVSGATVPVLTIGYADGATHEWDTGIDAATAETSAYIVGPGGDHPRLATSIVAPGTLPRWDLALTPVRDPIQLTWDPNRIPLDYGLFLTRVQEARGEALGESVDMVAVNTTTAGSAATYAVELERPESITLSLAAGWNLVSLPLQPSDGRVAAVFGTLAASPFSWPAGEGEGLPTNYRTVQDVVAGEGMWLYQSGSTRENLTIRGRPVRAWTRLAAGWNLIGPIAETPLPDLPAIAAPVWWYDTDSGSYRAVAPGGNLLPGNGYWIFALEETVLDLTE